MPLSRVQAVVLAVCVACLAGSLGFAVAVLQDRPPQDGSVDVGFLRDMIAHHEQAIELSQYQLADGTEPIISVFAREVLQRQSYEIGLMEATLRHWGHDSDPGETAMGWMGHHDMPVGAMPGLATQEEMDVLANAEGRAVDALFVRLMQDHHRGGIDMAEEAASRGASRAVREMAATMASMQRGEVAEMEAARQRIGLDPRPPGWTSDFPS